MVGRSAARSNIANYLLKPTSSSRALFLPVPVSALSKECAMLATSGRAKTEAQEFIEASRIFLKDDFLPKLKHCLKDLPEQDLWWRPNEQSNSVGNLILHLCGNMSQWILNSMG